MNYSSARRASWLFRIVYPTKLVLDRLTHPIVHKLINKLHPLHLMFSPINPQTNSNQVEK